METVSSLMFSQPPRRQKQHLARTVSHSFEESERSSAAYEVDLGDSDADSELSKHPRRKHSLAEELHGTSLQSSRVVSALESVDIPCFPSSPPEAQGYEEMLNTGGNYSRDRRPSARLSSPQLPLPPPFSSVSRKVSTTSSFPGASPPSACSSNLIHKMRDETGCPRAPAEFGGKNRDSPDVGHPIYRLSRNNN